uniref:Glycosyl transferase CAP10 domain-containing protein n=1 Tax=Mycena chlorophos TaxID=658473 RepID=A0ABQ0KY46_MYCCL|nr:predicted protein [Mycena chlorophos]
MDGVGYSGRFMALLASDSVPLKATVYDEFFAGWIEPWVHYIPLSAAYSEIYNVVAYFSGPAPAVLNAAGLSSLISSSATGYTYFGAPSPEQQEYHEGDPDEDATRAQERRVALVQAGQQSSEGDRRLRRIARAGKQWKATMGRKVDMEVYVYRLALEYARLWADDREAMSYDSDG